MSLAPSSLDHRAKAGDDDVLAQKAATDYTRCQEMIFDLIISSRTQPPMGKHTAPQSAVYVAASKRRKAMTLDEFLDESVRRSAAVGYHPTKFIGMRDEARKRGKSVVSVIKSLVESSEPRSGYVRLVQLGLTEWSLESAVLKYPQEFERRTIAFAEARRNGTLDASKPKRA